MSAMAAALRCEDIPLSLFVLTGIFSVFCPLNGAQWFVSPAGNDKAAGTSRNAFATISQAVRKAQPGDTIQLAPGIYREEVVITKSGKKGVPVTLKGSRGRNGEYLSIIEAPGITPAQWLAAPEIGDQVWKTPMKRRPQTVLMDGKMIVFINRYTMQLPRWKQAEIPVRVSNEMLTSRFDSKCKRLPGLDWIAAPASLEFEKTKSKFWPLVSNVISGWHNGFLYVRFANGDKPHKHRFSANSGNGFTLKNARFWNFSDLYLRGSRCQFRIQGKSSDIEIRDSLMMHGGARIRIDKDASHILVQNNILTAGFINGKCFGTRDRKDMRASDLYVIFKYLVGTSLSDDSGVLCFGSHVKILDNTIVQGLIGIEPNGTDNEVAGNLVRGMSSCGIVTHNRSIIKVHHNVVMYCGIPLRFHYYAHYHDKRIEYHYNNLYIQPPDTGTMIHVHCWPYGPDETQDAHNFSKTQKEPIMGGPLYDPFPKNPVDPGKFYLYHNTFVGGYDFYWDPVFPTRKVTWIYRKPSAFYIANNLCKSSDRYYLDWQRLLAGNCFYNKNMKPFLNPPKDPNVQKFNKVLRPEEMPTLWSGKNLPSGMPDIALSKDSPALECGYDLSKDLVLDDLILQPLPGMKPGYFKGKAPAAGALQAEESAEYFDRLYRRGKEVIRMLEKMKYAGRKYPAAG